MNGFGKTVIGGDGHIGMKQVYVLMFSGITQTVPIAVYTDLDRAQRQARNRGNMFYVATGKLPLMEGPVPE